MFTAVYKLYKGDKEVRALNKIAEDIGVEFSPHASDEDARVSLLTLKYIVDSSGLTLKELLSKYNVRKGENRDFVLTRTVSLSENVKKRKRAEREKGNG